MKKSALILWYLKSFRVVIGILCFLTATFASPDGKLYRSSWDDSLRYQKPMAGDMKVGTYVLGACALFFGLRGRYKKLQALSNEQNSNREEKTEIKD